jgi:putative ABC transport system permease protein
MNRLRGLLARLGNLFHKEQLDHDLDNELANHLELHIADNLRAGMTSEQARHAAMLKLGGIEQTKESVRDQRGIPMLETFLQDLRFGLRMLRKSPAFTAIAILTLAVGIGANTAIFSFVSGALLRSLPYRDANRLMILWSSEPERGWKKNIVSAADFADWRAQSKSFEDMAGYIDSAANLSNGHEAMAVNGLEVTSNFFSVLGLTPELGQSFRMGDDRPGAPKVALISHALWVQRFASDPAIAGKIIQLNQQSYTILGVMPASFVVPTDGESDVQFWTPFELDPVAPVRDMHAIFVVGRLAAGATQTRAQQEMTLIAQRLQQQYRKSNAGWTVAVETLNQSMSGNVRPVLLILMGAVGCVLLIACVNVANLQLSRGVSRRREFAIRGALGADRKRVVRQLLTESILLSFSAAALGILLAQWSVELVRKIYLATDPGFAAVRVDARVLLFTLALSVITAFLFGLAPAWMTSGVNPQQTLKESGRSSGASAKTHSLRGVLVAGECALAVVLLVGAGLLIRTFDAVTRVDPGFDPHNVLSFHVSLAGPRYEAPADRAVFYDRMVEKIKSLPGVEAASIVTVPPFLGYNGWGFITEENPAPPPEEEPDASYQVIGPEYFQTLRIPLLQGRTFTLADRQGSALVAIINKTLAQKYWPGEDVLGKHLRMSTAEPNSAWMTVVGIVGDVRRLGLAEELSPELYVPYRQYPWMNLPRSAVVRTYANPLLVANAIRRSVSEIDPNEAIDSVTTMERVIHLHSLNDRSFNMVLLGTLAGLALLLSVVGIYSVMSYSVSQRTQEIGVRLALGARRKDVLWLVLRIGAKTAIIGVAIGLFASLLLSRLMSSLLFKVSAADPATFISVGILLSAVVFLANYIPARRATQVDPMVALRYE